MELLSEYLRLDQRSRDQYSLFQLLRQRLYHQRNHQDHIWLKELDIFSHPQQGIIDADHNTD